MDKLEASREWAKHICFDVLYQFTPILNWSTSFFISSGEKIIHGHFCNVICNVNSLIYNTRWTNDKNVRRSVKNCQKGVKLKTYVGESFATSSKNIMNIPHLGILQYAKYCSILKLSYCNLLYGFYIDCLNPSQST